MEHRPELRSGLMLLSLLASLSYSPGSQPLVHLPLSRRCAPARCAQDSSQLPPSKVNEALREESARSKLQEDARQLPRSERRKVQAATRKFSQLFVSLEIEALQAMEYAECLVGRGMREPSELTALDEAALTACGVRKQHRQKLVALRDGVLGDDSVPAAASLGVGGEAVGGAVPLPSEAAGEAAGEVQEEEEAVEEETHTLSVGPDLAGSRLDAALAALMPPLGRSYFSELCGAGRVTVAAKGAAAAAGAVAKKSLKVKEGEVITVRLKAAAELTLEAEDLPLSILYEDEHVVGVNKAAGMVVHPAPGHWSGTLINGLLHRYRGAEAPAAAAKEAAGAEEGGGLQLPDLFGDGLRPGIVHRLDRYTTGVILAARSLRAQQKLVRSRRDLLCTSYDLTHCYRSLTGGCLCGAEGVEVLRRRLCGSASGPPGGHRSDRPPPFGPDADDCTARGGGWGARGEPP